MLAVLFLSRGLQLDRTRGPFEVQRLQAGTVLLELLQSRFQLLDLVLQAFDAFDLFA